WGFVVPNGWGDPEVIYPTIRFDRMSLARSSEDFQLIKQLVENKNLPVSYLLKNLGFDPKEVETTLKSESGSILNPAFYNFMQDLLSERAEELSKNDTLKDMVKNALNLN
ncbi:hypothetical protein ThvES_00020070, partial [Thiovulum sp. ES]